MFATARLKPFNTMKFLLPLFCLLFGLFANVGCSSSLQQEGARPTLENTATRLEGTITYVFDGDTVQFRDKHGKSRKIRLNKIDAPEHDQPFGDKANRYLRSLVLKQDVTVEIVDVDTYGRDIGILFVNGEEVNLKMVQDGYAWHYAYHDQTPAYIEAEKAARKAKKGLWSAANPINPYQWRKAKH
jgi:endonuclease YncB( thermonuclease family)